MNQVYALPGLRSTKPHTVWAWCVLLWILASFSAQAQTCALTIKPTVSGCYLVGGVSKATVSVEVSWTAAPSGETITVTYMGQTRTITPGVIAVQYPQSGGANPALNANQTIVSPQVVDFEVNLPAAAGAVTASFSGGTCTATPVSVNTPAACPPLVCPPGGIAGVVFNDYNADGIKDSGETNGVPNVTVTAISCDGTKYTASTNANGQYVLNIPAGSYPVRVEFTGLPALYR